MSTNTPYEESLVGELVYLDDLTMQVEMAYIVWVALVERSDINTKITNIQILFE